MGALEHSLQFARMFNEQGRHCGKTKFNVGVSKDLSSLSCVESAHNRRAADIISQTNITIVTLYSRTLSGEQRLETAIQDLN